MDNVINLRMIGHPVNWLIVWSVLAFGGLVLAMAHHAMNGDCGCGSAASAG